MGYTCDIHMYLCDISIMYMGYTCDIHMYMWYTCTYALY